MPLAILSFTLIELIAVEIVRDPLLVGVTPRRPIGFLSISLFINSDARNVA